MNYAYIRVSTDKQTTENQKHRLTKIQFVAETISGTREPSKRKLGELMQCTQAGDVVIINELSRLGRSLIMIFNVLQTFLDKEVKVIAIRENYELGDNVQSKVLAFAFGLSAEIERQLISERTKAGLERARRNGKQIGRRPGESPTRFKLTGKEKEIKKNYSKARPFVRYLELTA